MKVSEIKHLFNKNNVMIIDLKRQETHGTDLAKVWIDHDKFQDREVIRIEPYKRPFHGGMDIHICV